MILEIKQTEKYKFQAEIYKTGINYCVDVPKNITSELIAIKGYIKIKGIVNKFPFKKHLVPVKFGLYRLFVNVPTLKGANTSVGEIANFEIEQDFEVVIKEYPVPKMLMEQLRKRKLFDDFSNLSKSRKKVILKYMSFIKTEKTLMKNIEKLIIQLENKERNTREP